MKDPPPPKQQLWCVRPNTEFQISDEGEHRNTFTTGKSLLHQNPRRRRLRTQHGGARYLAAEIIVGDVEGEEGLQACRSGVAVLQEEAMLLGTEECDHRHLHLGPGHKTTRTERDVSANCNHQNERKLTLDTYLTV